ncbi:ocellar opsin [Nephila pilipes]|uniref:Ocellar opsin n=2 Tax=Nephila pilipes TaxID=299642 RepID=A0A8X6U2K5_NEPPI|nr:ocellar opsin [Nephila pilipes]
MLGAPCKTLVPLVPADGAFFPQRMPPSSTVCLVKSCTDPRALVPLTDEPSVAQSARTRHDHLGNRQCHRKDHTDPPWVWSAVWTLLPFFGWNRYVPEGNMTSCTIDYLTKDFNSSSYVIIYGLFVYFVPLITLIYNYTFIVRSVANHEKELREQAKKMNVSSLRANSDQQKQSAECRLAKVAMMTVGLWFIAWTPYLSIAWSGVFSAGKRLTPLATIWGSVFAKAVAVYNPIVYGISHPKYRAALHQKFPSLACATDNGDHGSDTRSESTVVCDEKPPKNSEA